MSSSNPAEVFGVIAECNPFHEGHRYLLEKIREESPDAAAVCVMSGDFTQRGMPAVQSKWERTEALLEGGADLVLELPAVYACASAPYFAYGGIGILEGLGIVRRLAFGSESGEVEWFRSAASFFGRHREELERREQALTKEGLSFPRAREQAARELGADFDLSQLEEPNNILGLEYALHASSLDLFTVPRKGAGHHVSGTLLREQMRKEDPERFREAEDRYYRILTAKILSLPAEELEKAASAGGGLGHLLKKKVRSCSSLEELTDCAKSKVYTRTRITRMFAQTLLGVTREKLEEGTLYTRLLAADQRGLRLLHKAKKTSRIPVLTNLPREAERCPKIRKLLDTDILASDLFNLIWGRDLYQESDWVHPPVIRR